MKPDHAFQQQGEAEGRKKAVEVVEPVQPAQHRALDQDAEQADQQRGDQQHHPVVQAETGDADVGGEGAHHVQRAVREVDDVQQAEDDGQAQREHGVEGAVDQAEQELAQQGLVGDAEDVHVSLCSNGTCDDALRQSRGYKTSFRRRPEPNFAALPVRMKKLERTMPVAVFAPSPG